MAFSSYKTTKEELEDRAMQQELARQAKIEQLAKMGVAPKSVINTSKAAPLFTGVVKYFEDEYKSMAAEEYKKTLVHMSTHTSTAPAYPGGVTTVGTSFYPGSVPRYVAYDDMLNTSTFDVYGVNIKLTRSGPESLIIFVKFMSFDYQTQCYMDMRTVVQSVLLLIEELHKVYPEHKVMMESLIERGY